MRSVCAAHELWPRAALLWQRPTYERCAQDDDEGENSRRRREAIADERDGGDREGNDGWARESRNREIGAEPEKGLCKANFGDPGCPYGRTTSHPPTFLSSSSNHAQSRPQELRPRSCAGRLQSAYSGGLRPSLAFAVLNGVFRFRALPVAPPLLLALMRQLRPVRLPAFALLRVHV